MNQQHVRLAESFNVLLRMELAAAQAYQRALRSLNGVLGSAPEKLLEQASARHQRNAAALMSFIRALGSEPATRPATRWSPFTLFRDRFSVQHWLDAETLSLVNYEAALLVLDAETRDIVAVELIPRQRRHVGTLSKILAGLPAE